MRIEICRPDELSAEHIAQWRNLCQPWNGWDSPFYEPTWLQLLGVYRPQLEVAMIDVSGELAGVFAYERDSANKARPPGVKLCDFQGPVLRDGFSIPPEELLRACRLKAWQFDHQPLTNDTWKKWSVREADSRFIRLSGNYEEYVTKQKTQTSLFSQSARKRRKLEREVGAVEFHWHCEERSSLDLLLEWKSNQREATGTFNLLDWDWAVSFLRDVQLNQSPHLQGVLSTLLVEGQVAAVHLGMVTPTAFHYWFPTYNPEFRRYSPGQILLLHMIEAATEQNLQRFDFGKGEESYKQKFATDSFTLGEGVVDFKPFSRVFRGSAHQVWGWVKSSPVYGPANQLKRWMKRQTSSAAMNQTHSQENL